VKNIKQLKLCICIYPAVTLVVYGVPAAVEFHVVAVAARIEAADVNACVVAVRRRAMRITHTLLKIMSGTAVLLFMVVTSAVHEVAAAVNCLACGSVADRREVFIAFVVDEIFADSRRIVTAVDK